MLTCLILSCLSNRPVWENTAHRSRRKPTPSWLGSAVKNVLFAKCTSLPKIIKAHELTKTVSFSTKLIFKQRQRKENQASLSRATKIITNIGGFCNRLWEANNYARVLEGASSAGKMNAHTIVSVCPRLIMRDSLCFQDCCYEQGVFSTLRV